jgi:hypothetical protein
MDFRNKSIALENITSFDVNKAIQRSLTKAVARHGLGLYIYAGEDLPVVEDKKIAPEVATALLNTLKAKGYSDEDIGKSLAKYKVKSAEELTELQYGEILQKIKGA